MIGERGIPRTLPQHIWFKSSPTVSFLINAAHYYGTQCINMYYVQVYVWDNLLTFWEISEKIGSCVKICFSHIDLLDQLWTWQCKSCFLLIYNFAL